MNYEASNQLQNNVIQSCEHGDLGDRRRISAQAATVTGNIGVTIELGSGCQINGHAGQTQPLDFGDIDFDEWMSLSTNSPNIDANTSGSAGGEYNGDQSNRHQRMSTQFI